MTTEGTQPSAAAQAYPGRTAHESLIPRRARRHAVHGGGRRPGRPRCRPGPNLVRRWLKDIPRVPWERMNLSFRR